MSSVDVTSDLPLLLTAASAAADERVFRRLAGTEFSDLRYSHGFVFQHLMLGAITIGTLAERLGITQQGTSKVVAELERMGYVRRIVAAYDQRVRLVELTERGMASVQAKRRARAEVGAELMALLGPDAGRFLAILHQLAKSSGGLDRLTSRRLRQDRAPGAREAR